MEREEVYELCIRLPEGRLRPKSAEVPQKHDFSAETTRKAQQKRFTPWG
jgi:hypothetical protein